MIRVAIYTRQSVADDLEFNSLEAQRQAVEAYIESQRSEGWVALPERYDDGGCTGANTDRPAFQRLLEDVERGGIDIVACYKLDRLSRSITDFVRVTELFGKHGDGGRSPPFPNGSNGGTPRSHHERNLVSGF